MGALPEAESVSGSRNLTQLHPSFDDDSPPILKLMVPEADFPSDYPDDILQTTIESAKQIQQLAERLRQNQAELARAEQEIERRLSQLQQKTAQVRLQQRNVMHLQTSLLKSHEASKIAIEQLVAAELTDATTLQQMKAIRNEVSERFDYMSFRWQHLFQLLENQRVQLQAEQSLRDVA